MSEVKPCDCQNKGQDEIHGKGMRVHNLGKKESKTFWRCTVCGKQS